MIAIFQVYYRDSQTLGEILVAIVFGLENPTFLAKSDIWIPKCTGVLDSAHKATCL